MRKERFIIIMAMLFFSITSAVALEIQMSCRPISTTTNGPRRMPSNNNTSMATGDVTTSNANITLRANEILLDSGTYISVGSTLKTVNP